MNFATLWPYALALVLLLAAVIVVLLVLVLRKSAKVSQFSDAAEPEEEPQPEGEAEARPDLADQTTMGAAFTRAKNVLGTLSDRDQYRSGLHLVIGAENSREPGFLMHMAGSRMQLQFEDPVSEGLAFGNGCGFHFFDKGIVVDLAGPQVLAADGVNSDGPGWKAILRQLRNLRPKRPADGIILTVPAVDLRDARRAESRLAARADRLHRKLWEIQRELGFRLPVYVLVTGCENLSGFSDLCISLPPEARGEMLGWSSPHATESPYSPSWLDEAFEELHHDLGNMQMELFAGGERPKGVLLFPWSLRALKKPLNTFLSHLFRSSAYHEGMTFRGFYFTGTNAGDAFFTAELLAEKIFPETGIAVPSSRTRMARDRKVRLLQSITAAAALFAAGGLLWAWLAFRHQNNVLVPLLNHAVEAQSRRGNVANVDEAETATQILDGMAKIDFHRYSSVFVPASWFGSLDSRLRSALMLTFSSIVLDEIELRLEKKVEVALDQATQRITTLDGTEQRPRFVRSGSDPVVAIDEMQEFNKLKQFVSTLQKIEMYGNMLNGLSRKEHGELHELGDLAEFAFGHQLNSSFFRSGELYERALKTAQSTRTFKAGAYQAQTSKAARQLSEDFYRRLYVRNPFLDRLGRLETALTTDSSGHETSAEQFRELAQSMRAIENDLAGPELQWAFRPSFDLGPSYNAIVSAMGSSQFFGPEFATGVREHGAAGWSDFNLKLTASTPVTGSILSTRDGRPEMKLSTDTLLLDSAIQAFLHQEFVAAREHEEALVTTLNPGERLIWNPRLLQQSVNVYTSYERFREKGLKIFSADLQAAVDGVAREHVAVQMLDILKAAETIEPAPSTPTNAVLEAELQNGIDRFNVAAKLIDRNMEVFAALDAYQPRNDLIALMTAEAARLLRMDDELMLRNAPYTMKPNFAWASSTAPSPDAWGARDPAELGLYLDTTRGRLSFLARSYARPLLTWMANAGTDDLPEHIEVVSRWQSILDDLDDYDAKKPANALAAFEDYIGGAMTKVTTKDCTAAILSSPPRRRKGAPGYLATRLDDLSRQISDTCWGTATQDAVRRYTRLAAFFNERLSGRYPFVEKDKKSPASIEREASPEDIRRFYAEFDDVDALIRTIPKDKNFGWPLQGARPFMDEMRDVRKFFAGYVSPTKPKRDPEVQIETEFRILQTREHAGNEIIRWALSVGNDTVTARDKTKKLRWVPDKPVELSLQWASDAPHVPVLPASDAKRGMTVSDRVVTYKYTNKWALLSALADLGADADEFDPGVVIPPVTLSLVVPTKPIEGAPPLEGDTKVYLRLALLSPEGEPLDLPSFPPKAPQLESFVIGDAR